MNKVLNCKITKITNTLAVIFLFVIFENIFQKHLSTSLLFFKVVKNNNLKIIFITIFKFYTDIWMTNF